MKTEEILKEFETVNTTDLAVEVLRLRALLRIEKAQASWLDRLADELRDGEEGDESEDLYREFIELRKLKKHELLNKYGIEL